MKAGIYNGIKQIEMKELPRPTSGDNDAVIRVVKAEHLRHGRTRLSGRRGRRAYTPAASSATVRRRHL